MGQDNLKHTPEREFLSNAHFAASFASIGSTDYYTARLRAAKAIIPDLPEDLQTHATNMGAAIEAFKKACG